MRERFLGLEEGEAGRYCHPHAAIPEKRKRRDRKVRTGRDEGERSFRTGTSPFRTVPPPGSISSFEQDEPVVGHHMHEGISPAVELSDAAEPAVRFRAERDG